MKSQSKGIVLLLGLLVSCGGCKKQTEVEGETIPKAPACLIATQTMKELVRPSQQSTLELETVTINGESFQVSTTQKSVYTYDAYGRILTEYNQFAGSQAHYNEAKSDSVYYQYSPSAVSIRTVRFADSGKKESTDVIALNKQGYAQKRPNGYQATYDKEGYLLTHKDQWGTVAKVDKGNLIEWIFFIEGPNTESYTYKNYYELGMASIPSIQSFYGKVPRNLITQYTVANNNYQGVPPIVHTANYSYIVDAKGNVTRQTLRGKDGDPGYVFGGDIVQINDFTYACP